LIPRPKGRGIYPKRFNLRDEVIRVTGIDLTKINGIEAAPVLKIISEIRIDMSR
jgi:hypothetical protein